MKVRSQIEAGAAIKSLGPRVWWKQERIWEPARTNERTRPDADPRRGACANRRRASCGTRAVSLQTRHDGHAGCGHV